MRASALEFRLRMIINTAIILLGFWAPWQDAGSRRPLLEWLPLELSRMGLIRFSAAVPAVIVLASIFAALGALLRVWGTAYLGPATVHSLSMKAGAVVADGPYRAVRNPLYLGLWCMVAALAFLMPPTGALCAIVLLTLFIVRLTLGEESFLAERLDEPYQAYLHAVPRFVPRLRSSLPSSGARPHWLRAVLAELTPIGIFVAIAFVSWTYNVGLMAQVILVSFGLSLVVRALMPSLVKEDGSRA
ncbi:MAG TPA: isoprenylcysteine carboxylmethyltransferase family protein [Terracidiphilus sp.]|jgi:protein-S-isoprenylcysteine O-methyltransferase Ste14|nr:isoprenylcysteine carboxylmethyltransferase family protein [Terracidiphilus sp.]